MHTHFDSRWNNVARARFRRAAAACEASNSARWLAKTASAALLVVTGAMTLGCGSDSNGDPIGETSGPLLPFEVGNTWTYRVIEDGVESLKITTVESLSVVGGEGFHQNDMAFHVVTRKGQGEKDKTESWQTTLPDAPDTVVRYREVSYSLSTGLPELDESWDEYKLHVSGEKALAGENWPEEYQELKIDVTTTPPTRRGPSVEFDSWVVKSTRVQVTAGDTTYANAVHLQKVSGSSGDTKDYWYVPGIGKVKETGGQTEELISHKVGDAP